MRMSCIISFGRSVKEVVAPALLLEVGGLVEVEGLEGGRRVTTKRFLGELPGADFREGVEGAFRHIRSMRTSS